MVMMDLIIYIICKANCEKATLEYIIRNHDLQAKKQIADFERIKHI